jgi:hypothetical protein
MSAHREAAQTYCARALIAAIAAGAALILAGFAPAGKGLIAGALASVLNFILIAASLPRRIGKTRRAAARHALAGLLLRLGVLAVPLVLALKYDLFHPAAAAAGLFAVQAVILGENLLRALLAPRGTAA